MGEHRRAREAIDHTTRELLSANREHRRQISQSGGDPGRPMTPEAAAALARKVAHRVDRGESR